MHPVGLDDELLVVHAVAGNRNDRRASFGVLLQQSFAPPPEHLQDLVVRTKRVELGPAVEVFERIIGAIVRAPPYDALEVSVIVKIFLKELAARRHIVGKELTLERGPPWRGHPRINSDRDTPPRRRRLPARETERRRCAE